MIRATHSTLNREENEGGSDITAVADARRNMTKAVSRVKRAALGAMVKEG
jgi:hypothetical protein